MGMCIHSPTDTICCIFLYPPAGVPFLVSCLTTCSFTLLKDSLFKATSCPCGTCSPRHASLWIHPAIFPSLSLRLLFLTLHLSFLAYSTMPSFVIPVYISWSLSHPCPLQVHWLPLQSLSLHLLLQGFIPVLAGLLHDVVPSEPCCLVLESVPLRL